MPPMAPQHRGHAQATIACSACRALQPDERCGPDLQAQKLDDMLEKRSEKVDHVLNFQVPDDVLVRPQRLPTLCRLSWPSCASCSGDQKQ